MIQQASELQAEGMLAAAALGMVLYGLYSLVGGAADLLGSGPLEWWADLWLMVAGAMLVCGAIFVRASMPGGLALAVAGLLALQSISLHNAGHLYGQVLLLPQLLRLLFAGLLVALAWFGWESPDDEPSSDPGQEPAP